MLEHCFHLSSEQEQNRLGPASWRQAMLDSAHCRSDRAGDAGRLAVFFPLAVLCPAGERPRCLIAVPVGSPCGTAMAPSHYPTAQVMVAITGKNHGSASSGFFSDSRLWVGKR